jgi:hypothetical protein
LQLLPARKAPSRACKSHASCRSTVDVSTFISLSFPSNHLPFHSLTSSQGRHDRCIMDAEDWHAGSRALGSFEQWAMDQLALGHIYWQDWEVMGDRSASRLIDHFASMSDVEDEPEDPDEMFF